MTALAPALQAFFTTRLTSQLGASQHTVAAYRDTWRMFLRFAADAAGTAPPEAGPVRGDRSDGQRLPCPP